jgi:hypothetical protein
VLQWQDSQFVDISGAADSNGNIISAAVGSALDEGQQGPGSNVVSIEIPTEVAGPISRYTEIPPDLTQSGKVHLPASLAAIAMQGVPGAIDGEVDLLPGGAADPKAEAWSTAKAPMYLEPPAFPSCTPTPQHVEAGHSTTVSLQAFDFNGLAGDNRFNQTVRVYVGDADDPAASGVLQDNGAVTIDNVPIPSDTPEGLTTLTAVIAAADPATGDLEDTALTADCVLQVGEIQPPDSE